MPLSTSVTDPVMNRSTTQCATSATSLQHDILEPTPRARRRRARREAGAKRERGLPLVAGQARDALRPLIALPGLAFAVDHLDRLVERLHGEPARGGAQVQPLPDASGGERRLAIVAIADRDEAGQGRGSQLDVASVPEPGRVARLGRNRKEPRISEREERQARSIQGGSVAIGFDLGGRGRNQRSLLAIIVLSSMMAWVASTTAASNARRSSPSSNRMTPPLIVASPAQEFPPVRRYRLAPLVSVAIGVPQRDRAVETIRRARGPLFQADRGGRNGTASLGEVRERALDRRDLGVIAVRSRGDQHVLDCAAKTQMHLAHKGVHRAEIAREIGEHLDCIAADPKQPRLRVMRIGRQNRGARTAGASEAKSFHRPHGIGIALGKIRPWHSPFAGRRRQEQALGRFKPRGLSATVRREALAGSSTRVAHRRSDIIRSRSNRVSIRWPRGASRCSRLNVRT